MDDQSYINDVTLLDLRDSESVYAKFIRNGKLRVYIDPKYKKKVKRFYMRHKRFENLNHKAKANHFWQPLLFAYAFWKDVVLSIFDPNHEGYKVITFILMLFWHQIDHMKAEDIDENHVSVTFIPRT